MRTARCPWASRPIRWFHRPRSPGKRAAAHGECPREGRQWRAGDRGRPRWRAGGGAAPGFQRSPADGIIRSRDSVGAPGLLRPELRLWQRRHAWPGAAGERAAGAGIRPPWGVARGVQRRRALLERSVLVHGDVSGGYSTCGNTSVVAIAPDRVLNARRNSALPRAPPRASPASPSSRARSRSRRTPAGTPTMRIRIRPESAARAPSTFSATLDEFSFTAAPMRFRAPAQPACRPGGDRSLAWCSPRGLKSEQPVAGSSSAAPLK